MPLLLLADLGGPAKTKSGTTVIPLGRALLHGSSDLPGSCDAPSQHVPAGSANSRGGARIERTGAVLPYLVLLRVGFSLPPPLLAARCALTAPFHPYPAQLADAGDDASTNKLGGAVYFLWHFPSTALERRRPDVIRHIALWSSDFPPPARATWPARRSGTTSVHGPAATVRPSS